MVAAKPVKHHPIVTEIINNAIPLGSTETLEEVAAFYGKRLAKGKYLALEVPSKNPTTAMRRSGKTMKIIVLGVISQSKGWCIAQVNTSASWKELRALLSECAQ